MTGAPLHETNFNFQSLMASQNHLQVFLQNCSFPLAASSMFAFERVVHICLK